MNKRLLGKLDDTFNAFVQTVMKTVNLVELAVAAVGRYRQSLSLARAVEALRKERGKIVRADPLKAERARLPYAKEELIQGFPFLCGIGTVSVWSHLEAFIERLLVSCLLHQPRMRATDAVGKIRVSISDYNDMSPDERMEHVLEVLQRDGPPRAKHGIGQFEYVLQIFSLGGSVQPSVKKDLSEASAFRNIIVHRDGIADGRLVRSCPWLRIQNGTRIRINREMMLRYSTSVLVYGAIVYRRIMTLLKAPAPGVDQFIDALLASPPTKASKSK